MCECLTFEQNFSGEDDLLDPDAVTEHHRNCIMTYLDLLNESGGAASVTSSGKLATRSNPENLNHHLWNNRGTWWVHFTVHRDDYTAERVRVSLRTRDVEEARRRRDEVLNSIAN